jgi:plasmid stabilization system protein ParE
MLTEIEPRRRPMMKSSVFSICSAICAGVRRRERAVADAEAAVAYLRQHAPARAPAWYAGLAAAILSLEELPHQRIGTRVAFRPSRH